MRAPVIFIAVLFAAAALGQPRIETFPVPDGLLPTEIARHGDVLRFVSWKDWPAKKPFLGEVKPDGKVEVQPLFEDHMPGLFSLGPDGSIWVSEGRKAMLWRVMPDGELKRVMVGRTTLGIAVDADGSIWVTHPNKGDVTRYGPDGQPQAQWFVGRRRGPAGGAPRMTLPKMGVNLPRKIPKKVPSERSWTKEERKQRTIDARPSWIIVGPDEAVWFSEPTWKNVGRVTASGKVKLFELPEEWGEPRRIVAGPDGAVWFALSEVMALGRIAPDGEITTVDLPYGAGALATDSKGRIWFTDASGSQIGYLDAEGKLHELPQPKTPRLIRSMAEGPDGAMWFADQLAKVIGKISL